MEYVCSTIKGTLVLIGGRKVCFGKTEKPEEAVLVTVDGDVLVADPEGRAYANYRLLIGESRPVVGASYPNIEYTMQGE